MFPYGDASYTHPPSSKRRQTQRLMLLGGCGSCALLVLFLLLLSLGWFFIRGRRMARFPGTPTERARVLSVTKSPPAEKEPSVHPAPSPSETFSDAWAQKTNTPFPTKRPPTKTQTPTRAAPSPSPTPTRVRPTPTLDFFNFPTLKQWDAEQQCYRYSAWSLWQVCLDGRAWEPAPEASEMDWQHTSIAGCGFLWIGPTSWFEETRRIQIAGFRFWEGSYEREGLQYTLTWGIENWNESRFLIEPAENALAQLGGVRVHFRAPVGQASACRDAVYGTLHTLSLREPFSTLCYALQSSYLKVGERAVVREPVPLYPAYHVPLQKRILQTGTEVTLLEGPKCLPVPDSVAVVWKVRLPNGEVGWTFEGISDGQSMYAYTLTSPHRPPPTPRDVRYCRDAPPSPLRVGMRAYVCTQSDSLFVRIRPGRGGQVIRRIPPGTRIEIVDGPECGDGWVWWKVRLTDGTVGWVAEGGDEIDPKFVCPLEEAP